MKRIASVVLLLIATSSSAQQLLPQALSCGRTGDAGGIGGGTDLTRVTVDTISFPTAVCNGATPAVFYVAPYTREEDRNKWVIFLQGGGTCRNGELCAQRWCSVDTHFGMDKMSSSETKPSIRGAGILSPAASNNFGTWNRVLVYYCSSDTWAGTKTSVAMATAGSRQVNYMIHFKGHYIVDAVIDTLRRTIPRRRRPVSRTDEAHAEALSALAPLPDLDEATAVIFGGSSGGGGGVRNNVDRVNAKLKAANVHCQSGDCPLDFRAVIDATYGPAMESLDWTQTVMCAADPIGCSFDTFMEVEWNTALLGFWGAETDESCIAYHSALDPGSEWICGTDNHLVPNHITTPFFLRQDLRDSNVSGNFAEARFGTVDDYGRLTHEELQSLPRIQATAEETVSEVPGVFGPQCGDHEALARNESYFAVKVTGADGQAYSFNDLLGNWWRRSGTTFAVREFLPGRFAPECP